MGAAAINVCKGTPWSEELDGKELYRSGLVASTIWS